MHIWNNVEFAGTGTLNSTLSVLSVFWARIFFVQLNSFEISLPTLLASNNNSIPKQITFLSERDCKFQFISSKRINFIFGTIREFIIAPAAHNIRLNLSILRLVNNLHGSQKNCSKSIPWASAHHSHTHTLSKSCDPFSIPWIMNGYCALWMERAMERSLSTHFMWTHFSVNYELLIMWRLNVNAW